MEEEEEESPSESGEELSEWEEPGRGGRRTRQKETSWLVSDSDSDYQPSRGGGRMKRRRQKNRKGTRE